MLIPETNRLDYGEQLNPPEGYELDSAIATSYSLDLNTLLAVPIALCFNDTLDGDMKGEKLALLEAIGQLKGKFKVFYQKGNIAYPSQYNRLFTLLEPCLFPIVPEGGEFSSFHPKLWLLRFVENDKPEKKAKVVYRLIVLSRNLSFDRSWDVAATFDGVIDKSKAKLDNRNKEWVGFIKQLLDKDSSFEPAKNFKKELGQVVWQAPDNFKNVELIVGGGSYGRPVNIEQHDNDVLMVVSPFIKSAGGGVNALDWLSSFASDGEKYLFSRAEELNAVGKDKLTDWECFAINDDVVNGEERLELNDSKAGEDQQSQNLHAKIIINQKGNKTYWHLGSANSTTAALGDNDHDQPRNTETMVRMSGESKKIGPRVLMEQWLGEKSEAGLFVKHEFQAVEYQDTDVLDTLLRSTVHQLISAQWKLTGKREKEENKYTLILSVSVDVPLSEGVNVNVEQMAIQGRRELAVEMHWEHADISNISALIPVHVKVDRNGKCVDKKLLIESCVELEGGDVRHQHILKSLVDSDEKILNYVRLLLQVSPDKDQWLLFDAKGSGDSASSIIFSDSPIFEQLLIASSRHPKLLKRISNLLERLKTSGVDIPQEFSALWSHFEKELSGS